MIIGGWVKSDSAFPEDKTVISLYNEKHSNFEFGVLLFEGILYKREINNICESFKKELTGWKYDAWKYETGE